MSEGTEPIGLATPDLRAMADGPPTEDRSPHWPAVRDAFVKLHPTCEACGVRPVEAHHVKPFHVHPELELDPANLVSLCRADHFCFGHFHRWASWNRDVRRDVARYRKALDKRPKGREELATMTTEEQVRLLMEDYEERMAADARHADLTGRRVLDSSGAPLPPVIPTRPPFDWGAFWAQTSPYVFRIITIALAAAATYFGVDASHKAGQASTHAEAAVVQGQKNEVKIEATAVKVDAAHDAAARSAKQIDKIAGNAADKVPGN